jgi:polyketide biosynthesis enoyl-CoA hydratase PksH
VALTVRLPARLGPGDVARLGAELDGPGDVVVLVGGDGVFCEGLGLDGDLPDPLPFARLLARIAAEPRPVVAVVDGAALGGGCALAAAADLVLATPRATFGLPEVLWGLIPAAALPVVARRVGGVRARLLGLGIPALEADEAVRWGLADAVIPDEAGAQRHLKRLRRGDPRAVAALKALTGRLGEADYLEEAARRFAALAASSETQARLGRAVPWAEDSSDPPRSEE